jgi:hypothetical protein
MPNARELLEQADALMRRNRKRGKGRLDASTLTGVLEARGDLPSTVILPEVPSADAIALDRQETPVIEARDRPAQNDDEMPLDSLGDVPVLTDVVADWPGDDGQVEPRVEIDRPGASKPSAAAARDVTAPAAEAGVVAAGEAFPTSDSEAAALAPNAPAIEVIEQHIEADGVKTATVAARDVDTHTSGAAETASADHAKASSPFLDDDFILDIPPLEGGSAAVAVPALPSAPLQADSADWKALAEELRMQVLQRLDLFTDTGLREQLGARLSPIVERASTQMIETINRELGELVRGYVAEAIEREIESWRSRSDK